MPQLWALYKEVQDYYDKGMRVPDDVTLLLVRRQLGQHPPPADAGGAQSRRRRGDLLPLRLRRRPAQLQMDQHESHLPQDLGADAPGLRVRRGPHLDRERRRS